MRTPPTTPQLDFAHARAQAQRPRPLAYARRAREHKQTLDQVAARSESEDPARAAALDALKAAVVRFVGQLAIGQRFQSADFSRWLEETGGRPDVRMLAPQALGGLILHLRTRGLIRRAGFGMTGNYGGAKSSMRPVYRVKSQEFAKLDWPGAMEVQA